MRFKREEWRIVRHGILTEHETRVGPGTFVGGLMLCLLGALYLIRNPEED